MNVRAAAHRERYRVLRTHRWDENLIECGAQDPGPAPPRPALAARGSYVSPSTQDGEALRTGPSSPPRVEHAPPVAPGDGRDLPFVEAGGAKRIEDLRDTGRVAELGRHRRAVEVRTEPYVLDADPLGDVPGVARDEL
jgi:hypothetical protein